MNLNPKTDKILKNAIKSLHLHKLIVFYDIIFLTRTIFFNGLIIVPNSIFTSFIKTFTLIQIYWYY